MGLVWACNTPLADEGDSAGRRTGGFETVPALYPSADGGISPSILETTDLKERASDLRCSLFCGQFSGKELILRADAPKIEKNTTCTEV